MITCVLVTWFVAMLAMLCGIAAGRAFALRNRVDDYEDQRDLCLIIGFLIGTGQTEMASDGSLVVFGPKGFLAWSEKKAFT